MSKSIISNKALLAVGLGGMIGATLRYSISVLMNGDGSFPFATLIVNLIGCFFLSFLLHHAIIQTKIRKEILTAITTGVIGSFTTFSTFSVETVELLGNNVLLAVVYVILNLFGGILLCYVGYLCATKRQESI